MSMRVLKDGLAKIKGLIPIAIKKPIKAGINALIYYIVELRPLIQNIKNIRKIQLKKTVNKKIKDTLIKTVYLKRYNRIDRTANIVGNQVKFESFARIRNLFVEMFIKQPYYFSAKNLSPTIIDCGSHIGLSVAYFKLLYPQAKIICFEPNKYAYNLLSENIKINNLKDVELHNKALMGYDGETDFFINMTNKRDVATSTIKERVINGTKSTVEAITLSHFINDTVDYIKIDIEGAELEVLRELQISRKLPLVKQMAIEFHHHITREDDNLSTALKLLEQEGFGYHLEGQFEHPRDPFSFQDIMIFAYNKQLMN